MAVLLARQGATVLGVDLDLDAAAETFEIVKSEGHVMHVASCDVTSGDQVQALVDDCVARFGRLDVLINNVGRSEPGNPETMDEAVWRRQLDLNLTSAFLTSKAVLPVMASQGAGAIVNISSIAGQRWVGKDQVAYAAAKAGLIHFTKVTAVAYAAKGVRMNWVVPGLMMTPIVQRLADNIMRAITKEWSLAVTRKSPWRGWAMPGMWRMPPCSWPPKRRNTSLVQS